MNKIYRLKWNRSRNCWSVCSELGSRVKGKKSRAVLISAISLYSSLVFADDVIVNQDKAIDFGKENQSIDYRITVTDNANLVINTTDTSRPRLTLASGGGLDITGGKVTINGPLNFLLKGTGFLNVSNAGSELYADDLYESNSGMRHDQGYFNVSNGGKIHVKGTSRLTYTQGNVSGEGSQVNAGTFFMGVYGGYGGNQFLSVNNGGEVNAREHISLGYYDQRSDTTLVVSDGGKISAPKISLSTNSELALGAQEGSAAKAAGIIDAEKIEFVWAKTSDKKITLNHTDKNATISADIVSGSEGLGYINALNGTTYLTGDNSAFSGKVKIEQNGALGITKNIGTAEINNRGKLHLKADDSMTFANKISGNGTISIDSGTVALTGNNYAFSGYIDVASGAVAVISEDKNIGRADLDVDGKLQINANKDWVFDNDLQGRGIVEINMGNTYYTDMVTGEQKQTTMWMRHEGGHNKWRDGSGQLKTQSNRYVLQLGGDVAQWSQNGSDSWHVGVMAGYGNSDSKTISSRTGYRAKASVNGYSTGLYATWYADDESRNGAYLDSWAQYSWFDNTVKGDDLQSESYKSKGFTASLEAGYKHKLAEFNGSQGTRNEWYVQPQAQVTWMGVKADKHRESNGTLVHSNGDGNVQTRLGVKTWLKSHHKMDDGKSREFQPFVEVNWLHNSKDFSTSMDGVSVTQDGARNIAEIKTGVEGQLNANLNVWGNVGVQVADRGYNDTSAMVGIKWQF